MWNLVIYMCCWHDPIQIIKYFSPGNIIGNIYLRLQVIGQSGRILILQRDGESIGGQKADQKSYIQHPERSEESANNIYLGILNRVFISVNDVYFLKLQRKEG